MKSFSLQIIAGCIIFFCGCNQTARKGTEVKTGSNDEVETVSEILPAFQVILDSASVEGAILIFDPAKNAFYSNDFEWCRSGHLPASTFKIPNSIIALETGVISDDSTMIPWDGKKRRMEVWEQDLIFRDAFHYSCVPCYQGIARGIGVERMREYLAKFNYGNMAVDSSTIDIFWLEGSSAISQYQQIDFLDRFYRSELPISGRSDSIMKRMMVIEENDTFKLSGKTGWSIRNGYNNGWFVGYLEKENKVLFFATNINPGVEFNMDLFPVIRKEITMKALRLVW